MVGVTRRLLHRGRVVSSFGQVFGRSDAISNRWVGLAGQYPNGSSSSSSSSSNSNSNLLTRRTKTAQHTDPPAVMGFYESIAIMHPIANKSAYKYIDIYRRCALLFASLLLCRKRVQDFSADGGGLNQLPYIKGVVTRSRLCHPPPSSPSLLYTDSRA